MNLKEWSAKSCILPTYPTTEKGAVSVVINPDDLYCKELWNLSDYKVSSVCYAVVWLVPVFEKV